MQKLFTFISIFSGTLYLVSCSDNVGPMPSCVGSDLNAAAENTQNSGCGTFEGAIIVNATGGVQPYLYSLDGGTAQSSNVFEQIAQGDYKIRITGSDDCFVDAEVKVLSGLTYTKDVMAIFEKSCAITGCHVPGTGLPDWLIYDVARASATEIKARTQSRNMPQTGSLTQAEIDAIACWVDDGGLE